MSNRLRLESSPYLLQHAENPVDWYPWGDEAFQRAKVEDRPVLLSIGYSACHWCHVMAHESFENPTIAELMNQNFVNIKVDREERPDLDAIYMQAVQALTGRGGWPMTVFLTPEGIPFYGGTYYPPEDRVNMPGFPHLLQAIAEAYRSRRPELLQGGKELLGRLQESIGLPPASGPLDRGLLDNAFAQLSSQFDRREGGFGAAPKFPQPMALDFLLRTHHRRHDPSALQMADLTLQNMAHGGMYDQLGGGFHRYSTDAYWLVPHFEKMLYDNAQLARIYIQAFQAGGNPLYRRVAEETLDYVIREMTGPEGQFYSTQDADSEGVEGKFFVWTPQEIIDALGEADGQLVCRYFDVTEQGNWDELNILHVAQRPEDVAAAAGVSIERLHAAVQRGSRVLFERREMRVKPGLDDKALSAWNGLMLRVFAEAARVLERDDYREVAIRNAEFIRLHLWRNGRLLRSYRAGQAKLNGYLEDYALLINGLLSLYEATFDTHWFIWSVELARIMVTSFADEAGGGFFDTSVGDHEALVMRPKELFDNAMPSGNSAAAEALVRLSRFSGDDSLERRALSILEPLAQAMVRYPTGFANMLCAADMALASSKEIAVIGDFAAEDTRALLRCIFAPYLPNKVVAGADANDRQAGEVVPLLADRTAGGRAALVYVCEHFTCQMPAADLQTLAEQLEIRPSN